MRQGIVVSLQSEASRFAQTIELEGVVDDAKIALALDDQLLKKVRVLAAGRECRSTLCWSTFSRS